MNRIVNRRPGILVLPRSSLTLKPKETVNLEDITDELRIVSRFLCKNELGSLR